MDVSSLTFVAPGWLELAVDDTARALVRYEHRGQRAVVTALVVVGEALDSGALKSVSVGRVETLLNRRKIGLAAVDGRGGGRPPTEDEVADLAARGVLFPAECKAIGDALAGYFDKPRRKGARARRTTPRRPALTRPDGSDPEAFYLRVAAAYDEVVATTQAPAPVLAEEAGVPVATVHRWIAESRRRGFLPPARKGRAG